MSCGIKLTSKALGSLGLRANGIGQLALSVQSLGSLALSVGCPPEGAVKVVTQSNWYLDPVNGADTNTGLTPANALRTRQELSQRLTAPALIKANPLTITVLNDVPAGDPFVCTLRYGVMPPAPVTIQGTPSTLLSGTLTSAVNPAPASNTRGSITIAGTDWATAGPGGTSLVGYRIRRVTDGAISWVQKLGGSSDTVLVPRPTSLATGNYAANFAAGNQIVIERLTSWGGGFSLMTQHGYAFSHPVMKDLSVNDPLGLVELQWINLHGCDFAALRFIMGAVWSIGNKLSGEVLHSNFTGADLAGNWLILGQISQGYQVSFNHCSSTRRLKIDRSYIMVENDFENWDWTGGAAIQVGEGTDIRHISGNVWGVSTAANTFGIEVLEGYGRFRYNALPVLVGALAPGKHVRVGGADLTFAQLPYINSSNLAGIVSRAADNAPNLIP